MAIVAEKSSTTMQPITISITSIMSTGPSLGGGCGTAGCDSEVISGECLVSELSAIFVVDSVDVVNSVDVVVSSATESIPPVPAGAVELVSSRGEKQ